MRPFIVEMPCQVQRILQWIIRWTVVPSEDSLSARTLDSMLLVRISQSGLLSLPSLRADEYLPDSLLATITSKLVSMRSFGVRSVLICTSDFFVLFLESVLRLANYDILSCKK